MTTAARTNGEELDFSRETPGTDPVVVERETIARQPPAEIEEPPAEIEEPPAEIEERDYSQQLPDTGTVIPEATAFDFNEAREQTRSDLARGLLWLLTFAVGGVLLFIGMGRLEGTVLAQSIFPSLIALAGTALGFYFGSQTVSQALQTRDVAEREARRDNQPTS
jgi:hypothetical protein